LQEVSLSDEAARSGALFVPRADLGTLSVRGPDRLGWLQGVLTCDVADLPVSAARWGLILSRQGKVFADALVVASVDVVHLGIVRAVLSRAMEWLGGFLIMEDAELIDDSADVAWATLHGPQAMAVAGRMAARLSGQAAALDVTGLGGAVIVTPAGRQSSWAEEALAAGAVVASSDDWQRLRVERLVPLYGVDMDEQRNPHEASLDRRCVSWSKGCYLGQEAVCMQDMRGKVKRRLVLLRLDAEILPAAGAPVANLDGTAVGETRSAAYSRVLGGNAALALVAAGAAEIGTKLMVSDRSAVVVEPFR
jgi:hypothetical protein